MADSRATLLDFAIAASLAVVPVLLAVLLAMGTPAQRDESADRHVSVRQVAALATFEHAIVRRDTVQAVPRDAAMLLTSLPECAEWRDERPLDWLERPLGRTSSGPTRADRVAARLVELDRALAAMSGAGNRRVVDPVGFDLARWAAAARVALATPIETLRYPGLTFTLRCADLAAAASALSHRGGRMLGKLAWRGTEVERTVAQWPPTQYVYIAAQHLARVNPWSGIPGCIYLGNGDSRPAFFVKSPRAAHDEVCTQRAVYGAVGDATFKPVAITGEPGPGVPADDVRWQVPPSLAALIKPLETLQRTSGTLYRGYNAGQDVRSNHALVNGAVIELGFSSVLTIDPALQALAQRVAACYTGRQDVCRVLGIRRAEDGNGPIGQRLLERAMVRMAAIAIVDVASGRIEALAGALSPCALQSYDGPGRDAECDLRLPYPVRYRPDALQNPAVFHDAMPASIVKPVMAAAFLTTPNVGARWLAAERAAMRSPSAPSLEALRGQLMRSSSARFLDRMFCGEAGFRPCERPWEVQAMSSAFGWNAGCDQPGYRCGQRDLLFGRSDGPLSAPAGIAPVAAWHAYGRLMVEPAGPRQVAAFRTRAPLALDTAKIKRCAEGADGKRGTSDDWEKCRGGVVVDVVAEGWGQGHARATALGAAGMMATLAAAANGQVEIRQPHLVHAIRGTTDGMATTLAADVARWHAAGREPNRIARDSAEVILSGLAFSHRQGTARRACEQVLDARACRDIDWIAGKTGTPTFPNDDRSLDDLAKLCSAGVMRTRSEETACTGLRPYKWYVAAYQDDSTVLRWTKAIGVLTERNWLADTGRIHGAGDHGPNPAAEIAFQIASRHRHRPRGVVAGDER